MSKWQGLAGPFGARWAGAAAQLSSAAIVAALHRYQLLIFPRQTLDVAGFEALAGRLGELDRYPFAAPLAESEFVVPIVKDRHEQHNFGGDWHTDTSYLERPPSVTLLLAQELPDHGGDTLFADLYGAYAGLSAGMQLCLQRLQGLNSSSLVHDPAGAYAGVAGDRESLEVTQTSASHPVVRTHPATGKPALYVSLVHTERFAGMTRAESLPMLEFLQQHITRPENCVRLQWQPGMLALWDNRCLQHLPLNDYPGQRRAMLRIILRGERPLAFTSDPIG
jgi:taurine dioxygenase